MIIKKVQPKLGDRRKITKFALFPTRVGDNVVWFDYFTSCQEFSKVTGMCGDTIENDWIEIERELINYSK